MKRPSFFKLLSLIFLCEVSTCCELKTKDYANLILDVYDVYKPSSILLVYFADAHPSEMSTVFNLLLLLSKRKIQIITIPLKETHTDGSFNKDKDIRQTSRSMSVTLFTSKNAITKLNNFPGQLILNVSINILLFMTNDLPLEVSEMTLKSFQNKLHFTFRAMVLFKFKDDKRIRKWYLFNGNESEIVSWGSWEPDTRLILNEWDSNHIKRIDLHEKVLRVATVKGSPLTYWTDGKLEGYLADLLYILKDIMNFEIYHVKEEKEFGSWSERNQTWSGAMGLIVKGEVDLIVADLSMTPQRLKSVDFSAPLFFTQDTLYIAEFSNKNSITWTGYFQPFHYKIWVAILILIIATPLVLTLLKSIFNKSSHSVWSIMSECYFNVWRIYCQQGLNEVPVKSSLRLAYFSTFLCSFILMSLYSGILISYLTVPKSNLPFSTLEGFVKDGSYKLMVTKDGSEYDMIRKSNQTIFQKMNKLMLTADNLPITAADGFTKVCNDKVAFYESEILSELSYKKNLSCKLGQIRTGRFDSTALVLRKGSPFRSVINYQLTQLRENGILSRLKSKYFRVQSKTDHFHSANISEVLILLVILACGNIMGLILFFFEKIYSNYRLGNCGKHSIFTRELQI